MYIFGWLGIVMCGGMIIFVGDSPKHAAFMFSSCALLALFESAIQLQKLNGQIRELNGHVKELKMKK